MLRETQKRGDEFRLERTIEHSILAYADDLVILAKNPDSLQKLLDMVDGLSKMVGLVFNPKKCFTLHYVCVPPAGARNTVFKLNNVPVPSMIDGHVGLFLGRPIGSFVPRDTALVRGFEGESP